MLTSTLAQIGLICFIVVICLSCYFVPFVSFFINSVPYQISLFSFLGEKYDYATTKVTSPFAGWGRPKEYDYIVVGGGSGGAIVANRLSKHSSVLLLEAGGNPSWYGSIPTFTLEVALNPGTSYAYTSTAQEFGHLARKGIVRIPRGKGLGGSSSVNGMIYIRGSPKMFDEWATITGDQKWSYENVLPFFKKLEDYHGDYQPMDKKYHDIGGELYLETQTFQPQPITNLIQSALKEKGYELRDCGAAGPRDKDFTHLEHNMQMGARHGTYEAFLKPILGRSTLTILKYAEATKIHLDSNNRAYGVSYLHHGSRRFARANREVILSAGVIESPKLLMRSGIGPCDHLREVGIKCKNNLPVGQNLQDHPLFALIISFNDTVTYMGSRNLTLGAVWHYLWSGTGPFRSLGLVTTAYRSTSWDSSFPDIQMQFYGGLLRPWATIPEPYRNMNQGKDISMITVSEYLSKSSGELRLTSKRREDQPLINPNYYKDKSDVTRTIQGIKYALEVYEGSNVFQKYGVALFPFPEPVCDSLPHRSDEYWE